MEVFRGVVRGAVRGGGVSLFHFPDLNYSPSDGGGVTWYEPTPVKTASNPAEVLPPGIVHVYDGSSVTLNWSYSLTLSLGLGGLVIKFNGVGTVSIRSADGSTGMVLSEIIFRNGSA